MMLCLQAAIGTVATLSNASRASTLYLNECARCHGKSGNGQGLRTGHPMPRIHSFADCDWMSMKSSATLFLVIKNGSAAIGLPPQMPPFGGKLDDQQIADLVWYLRSICQDKNHAGGNR
jgi:cytochrome c oxidase cbb3-type subunit 3